MKSKSRLFVLIAKKKVSLPLSFLRLRFIEWKAIFIQFLEVRGFKDRSSTQKRVFNLDLHIAVIEDFAREFRSNNVKLTRFSISGHNHIANLPLPATDPVSIVNQRTWKTLDLEMIKKFRIRYQKFLETFDGFIVTYSPAFFELFSHTDKPILAVAATRYEAPYTGNQVRWNELNHELNRNVLEGKLTLIANNKGDADYLNYFTGIEVKVLPSYCGGKGIWTGDSSKRVTLARDYKLKTAIQEKTHGLFQPIDILGTPYKWKELLDCLEVFVIPQNISTMTLFELSTAGVPVVVPGRKLFLQLREEYSGVLDELTFAEINGLHIESTLENPANWKSEKYLDWWLDRSDFYDKKLMPNVRVADTLDELMLPDESVLRLRGEADERIQKRNISILKQRQEFMSDWLSKFEK